MDDQVVVTDPAVPPWSIVEFRAMGSRCRIVTDDERLARLGRELVEELERCWTRFAPDSELNRVNAAPGRLCLISRQLHVALTAAARARALSGGVFDVRCLDAVERAGYERSWSGRAPDTVAGGVSGQAPPPVPDHPLELFDDPPAVLVPEGHRLDLGGIGKGLAADLVVERLLDAGAERVQVELGGDVRVAGEPWCGDRWTVEVEDPLLPGRVGLEVQLEHGAAVATSSVLRRRWRREGVTTHHLIDLRTMTSASTDLVAVTAIAEDAWIAEVAAKCALIVGHTRALDVIEPFGARALLFGPDGSIDQVAA